MMNDRLKRVQTKREKEVPIHDCWYLFIKENGTWDAGQTNDDDFLHHVADDNTKNIFAIWHGQRRTNLFLMDKNRLMKSL